MFFLAARRQSAGPVVLHGDSVAVEFVYRRQADYDLVWCVNGEQPTSLLADLASLASKLGLATDAPQEAQVAALRGWLNGIGGGCWYWTMWRACSRWPRCCRALPAARW